MLTIDPGGTEPGERLLRETRGVPPVESLELVVGEAVAVQEPGEGHFPMGRHGVHSMVHRGAAQPSARIVQYRPARLSRSAGHTTIIRRSPAHFNMGRN